jgi:hypothetical protein
MARPRVLRPRALALAAGLALAACSAGPAPDAGLPPGALLLARTTALEQLLATASRLEGTRLAREARGLAERLPACEWVEAQADASARLPAALRCGDPSGALSALHRRRGQHDVAFALPAGGAGRMVGEADLAADGTLSVSLRLPEDVLEGPAGFLLPGREPAGPAVLAASEQILHARVRAGERLDLASFVPAESQAAHLFHLKSALFSGLVLDDTWEAAVYLPETGRSMPRTAIALGVREREAAIAAVESFIDEIRESWPVRRSEFSFGGASGACLPDLNLLPDLAPCYVATERALVVGWNPASVRKALGEGSGRAQAPVGLDAPGVLVLDLALVEQADARLRAQMPAGSRLLPRRTYPWRRLSVSGERGREGVHLRLRLAAGESA